MSFDNRKLQSLFSDVPRDRPAVDSEGNFIFIWETFFGNISQQLQTNFKNEGIMFPPLFDGNIASIEAIYTPLIGGPLPYNIPDISGQTVFDSTNRVPKQFIISYDASTPPNITSARWWTFTLT